MTRLSPLLLAALLAGACSDTPTGEQVLDRRHEADPSFVLVSGDYSRADEARDVASLRAATARFQRLEVARDAGYDEQFPPGCMFDEEGGTGGMGMHYINWGHVGSLDVERPQLVIYEPQKNGTSRLVAVEYIYPGVDTDPEPVLFGRKFTYNYTFEVWALHAWVWRHNPAGMFKDYNPTVSCAHAPAVASSSHH